MCKMKKLLPLLLFLLACNFVFAANKTDDSTKPLTFFPVWTINDSVTFQGTIQWTVATADFNWSKEYINTQKFTVKAATDSSYILLWQAQGFPANIFQNYPGPMYDWFQEWSKGKTIDFMVKFDKRGVPKAILNSDSVRSFYLGMVDSFLTKLPSRDVAPLNKNSVKQSLMNLKQIIKAPNFANSFINSLYILFPFYGKSFVLNKEVKLKQYKKLSTLNFSVPIDYQSTLEKESESIYSLTSEQKVVPFDQWRIKPSNYSAIDFIYTDKLDFKYDSDNFWTVYALHSQTFERKSVKNNFVISYTKLK